MIKALLLIFDPIATWDSILRVRRSVAWIFSLYLLPLLLLPCLAEGYGMVHWGKSQSQYGHLKRFTVSEAVVVETAQFLLLVLVVFVGAKLLKAIGETFHGRHTFTQAITAVAYSMSPLFLFRLLDMFPAVSPWVSWTIGILLSVAVLYHGVPRTMEPDPSHAFGLYVISALLMILITGLVRYLSAFFLQGQFPVLQNFVSQLAGRLPF